MRIFKTKKNFKNEFKRQLRYAIAAAVGFLIIFAWRDAIIESTKSLVAKFAETTKIATTDVSAAMLITIVGVLIIVISSRILRDK